MIYLQILLTLVVFVVFVVAIAKKFNAATTLLLLGTITLLVYTVVTGTSVQGTSTSGSIIIDVFELCKSKFSSQMSGTGFLIMTVMGYVKFMDHIKASKLLALYCAKPLKKLGSPYLAVVISMVVGALLKLCIPSHSSLTALLMATIYPILIYVGVTPVTAASSVIIAGAYDMGPACPITTWAVGQEPVGALTDVANFFVNYQLWRTGLALAAGIVVFVIVSMRADKKAEQIAVSTDDLDPKSLGVPFFYALLPLIPLVLVVVFSSLLKTGITISVQAANILAFLVALVIHVLCCKTNKVKEYNSADEFWKGMGSGFSTVVSLIVAAAVFSAALDFIGGTKAIMNSLGGSSLGGYIVVAVAALINIFIAFMTGSGVASSYTVLPMLYPVVEATGINLLVAVFAIVASGGLGRAISPVSGALIIGAGGSNLDVFQITKRTMLPIITSFVVVVLLSMLAL